MDSQNISSNSTSTPGKAFPSERSEFWKERDMKHLRERLKVIVVGNGSVGKTSLIHRFAEGSFTDDYKRTLGVDFLTKTVYERSVNAAIHYEIWDTAGQEYFDSITRRYYRGAHCCLLVFAINNRDSFEAVKKWKQKVEAECSEDLQIVLIQNKLDLFKEATMSKKETEILADDLGVPLFRTCAKDDVNIDEVFKYIGVNYIERLRRNPDHAKDRKTGDKKPPKIGPEGFQDVLRRNYEPTKLQSLSGGEVRRKQKWKFCSVL